MPLVLLSLLSLLVTVKLVPFAGAACRSRCPCSCSLACARMLVLGGYCGPNSSPVRVLGRNSRSNRVHRASGIFERRTGLAIFAPRSPIFGVTGPIFGVTDRSSVYMRCTAAGGK